MSKEYTYKLTKSGEVIYRSVEPNYASKEDVDKKVLEKTGHDPRLTKHIIECSIRTLDPVLSPGRGRYDRNKRI